MYNVEKIILKEKVCPNVNGRELIYISILIKKKPELSLKVIMLSTFLKTKHTKKKKVFVKLLDVWL